MKEFGKIRTAQVKGEKMILRIEQLNQAIIKRKEEFDLEVKPLYEEIEKLEFELQQLDLTNVRRINVVEWKHPATGNVYLKGLFYFYLPGTLRKKSGTVHIGSINNFPLGKSDPRAEAIGLVKAQDYLEKKIKTR